jgi:hypothetical protein
MLAEVPAFGVALATIVFNISGGVVLAIKYSSWA